MPLPTRIAPRLRPLWKPAAGTRLLTSTTKSTSNEWPQRSSLGPFYEAIIEHPLPLPSEKAKKPPATENVESNKETSAQKSENFSSTTTTTTTTQSAEERIKLIFGSRYYGPKEKADREAARIAKSTYIGGTLVPPKPTEPDNCCMSGCVNCVWDLFREDMEEWSLKNAEAQKSLQNAESSLDSDGGGSWHVQETKMAKDLWNEDIYQDVPVGIREFMKQEKRIKERHAREATAG